MQDIPKLFTALAEWSACLVFVLKLRKRLSIIKTVIVMSGFLGALCLIQIGIGMGPKIIWIPGMILVMFLMYLVIFCCCRIQPADAVVYWSQSFLTGEFVAAFEWQLYSYSSVGFKNPNALPTGAQLLGTTILSNLSMIIFYTISYCIFYLIEKKFLSKSADFRIGRGDIVCCLITTIVFFFLSNTSYVFPNTPFSAEAARELFYIRTLVDFSGMIFLITLRNRLMENALKAELSNTNLLMQKQFEQYQFSKNNREMLSRKYHDWKHQINAILAESDNSRREGFLKELQAGIEMYNSEYQTGNNVMDTILTGKSILCREKGIQFICVADGALLNFMDTMDLCSILGNALDNAIEGAQGVTDRSHRIIRTAVYAKNSFVVIRFENYYEHILKMSEKDGRILPLTTKKDKELHGYGLKSIRIAVEKYDGTMTVTTENNWFYLRILIPKGEV